MSLLRTVVSCVLGDSVVVIAGTSCWSIITQKSELEKHCGARRAFSALIGGTPAKCGGTSQDQGGKAKAVVEERLCL